RIAIDWARSAAGITRIGRSEAGQIGRHGVTRMRGVFIGHDVIASRGRKVEQRGDAYSANRVRSKYAWRGCIHIHCDSIRKYAVIRYLNLRNEECADIIGDDY